MKNPLRKVIVTASIATALAWLIFAGTLALMGTISVEAPSAYHR